MRRLFFVFIFFFLAFAGLAGIYPAEAQEAERILSFNSRIEVNPDSTLRVSETIKVYSAGIKIKHGIYRDFPTRYTDRYGNKHIVGFEILEVLQDERPEQYRVESRYNGVRIYIGDPKDYLPTGEYSYTFAYRTTRQLGFFPDHDELYWNVTGNDWEFPAEQVQATVVLPQGASSRILGRRGYTGYQGSREEAVMISDDDSGNTVFEATRPFRPREGLTIVVSWPKGYVDAPSPIKRAGYFFSDNGAILFSLLGLLVVVGYYLVAWYYVGRDPAKGTIVPMFHPPKDLSPALARYIKKMGYDDKIFTAAVLNMAVKGFLKIEESNAEGFLKFGKTYVIRKTGKNAAPLSAEETAIGDSLLGARSEIELKNEHYLIFQKAVSKLRRVIEKEAKNFYFLTNIKFFVLGIIIAGFFTSISFFWFSKSGGSLLLVFCIVIVTGVLNLIFYYLLRAPTLKGRKVMDQIEGFKMFLSATEKDRLNLLNPPEKTPELFEKYLPYALALGVEQKWAEQFTDVFARVSQQGTGYSPVWYMGPSWRSFDTRGFAHSLESGFSGAIASSAVAPGSSSGFGGGGGSGGGGGGGGGGGW